MTFWRDEKEVDSVTLGDLENLCKQAFDIRSEVKKVEDQLKERKEALDAVNKKIVAVLERFGKTSYKSGAGTIVKVQKLSVQTPKTEEDKKKFFSWLREKGAFWQYVTVNSNSLNALYRENFDAAKESGEDFHIPGVGEPKVFEVIQMRR